MAIGPRRPRKQQQRILKTINGAQYERVGGGWAPVFENSKLWSDVDAKRQRRKSSDRIKEPGALPPLVQRDASFEIQRATSFRESSEERSTSAASTKRLPALGAGLPRRASAPEGSQRPSGFGSNVRMRAPSQRAIV